jgi:2-amino-4-hydroxy-6-hydroxymethyldihydropteridine diphosphokinase
MPQHNVILLLGSNILPEKNIPRALGLIAERLPIQAQSRIWETKAVGSRGPNFLNVAVQVATNLDAAGVKEAISRPIENQLGRIRSADKFMPRTMDIDVIVFDDQILDENLWKKAFPAIPVSELAPELTCPANGKSLKEIAAELKSSALAEPFEPGS